MSKLLVIGLGGFAGALARYGLSGLVNRATNTVFPYGTLVVNVIGCFLIGIVLSLIEGRTDLSPNVQLFVVIGLLSSFTTFSTLGHETLSLLQSGQHALALVNMAANALVGVLAVLAGHALVRVAG